MKGYLLSAAGVIFLTVIVSLLVPEGKLNKSITFIMRLVCIAVLIQPIKGLFSLDGGTAGEHADYVYISGIYSEWQSRALEKKLSDKFGVQTECNVDVEYTAEELRADTVTVSLYEYNEKINEEIYEYLTELGYINITMTTVYAEST